MRVLVHGPSLEHDRATALAAWGLALRGHAVAWQGPRPDGVGSAPETLETTGGGLALARLHADVVVGGGAHPQAPAVAGALAHARAMVLAIDHAGFERWRPLEHFGWSGLHATGLVREAEADAFRRDPRGLDLERLAMWSGAAAPATPDPTHPDVEILERACERALARHRGRSLRPAVFLDRDGTLVQEIGYLSDPDALVVLPGVPEALRALHLAGFALVVISNQAGVGRGHFPLERVHATMARLRVALRAHGVELDAVYFCPHAPDDGCACRKPGTELVERASDDLLLAPRRSYLVGDKEIDVETARRAGAAGFLVRTGHGGEEEQRLVRAGGATPERVFDDFAAAAAWILEHAHPGDAA